MQPNIPDRAEAAALLRDALRRDDAAAYQTAMAALARHATQAPR